MRIFRLELKRVLKSRLTWILLALALILSVLLAWLPTTYCYSSYTDEAGNEVNLTGLASIAYEKERQADAGGIVSACEARIASLMAMEQPDSPVAQRKAAAMYQTVEKPFEVYPGMSSNVMDYLNIMGFLVLLFCTVIAAPVFAADYKSGADDIPRCTRHGWECTKTSVQLIYSIVTLANLNIGGFSSFLPPDCSASLPLSASLFSSPPGAKTR